MKMKNNSTKCVCGCCTNGPCCEKEVCLTMSETFNFLLKRESLELLQLIGCFYSKKHLDELQSPECYRYIAYRATFCLLMKSGSLQWRNRASIGRLLKKRIMLPNCCVNKIRETFPDPQE